MRHIDGLQLEARDFGGDLATMSRVPGSEHRRRAEVISLPISLRRNTLGAEARAAPPTHPPTRRRHTRPSDPDEDQLRQPTLVWPTAGVRGPLRPLASERPRARRPNGAFELDGSDVAEGAVQSIVVT
jgi:hypothetical protein